MRYVRMNNGYEIPQIGFGVFMMTPEEVDEHLPQAIEIGYRHIDTANAYFNEKAVGRVVKASGIPREDFFVTTKLFPQSYPKGQCMKDIDATLARLDMDYIDLLLLHQPYGAYVEAWPVMEQAVKEGKVRSIGLSNFPEPRIREVLDVATIIPAVMQVEIDPYWNQHALKEFLAGKDMTFEAWYPLGHGDAKLLEEPVFTELAKRYGKTPAQVILRWSLQEGNVILPKSLDPEHMRENIDLFGFELTPEEMASIDALPQHPYYVVPDEAPDFVLVHNDYDAQQA